MRLAVVTVVAGRRDHLRRQDAALEASDRSADLRVVVVLDDAPLETVPGALVVRLDPGAGGLPLAAARNRGAETALRAGADLVVFLDVDCLPVPGALGAYETAMRHSGVALVCGAVGYLPEGVDHGHPELFDGVAHWHGFRPRPAAGDLVPTDAGAFWSLSFAVTRAIWCRLGGFDEGYRGYGAEDTDLGMRAESLGVPILVAGGAEAHHQYHPTSSPPVQHVDAILRNGARFAATWGRWPMQGWLDAFADQGLVERDARGGYRRAGVPA